MKVYISYVEQGKKEHVHRSEIINIDVNYCSREMPEIMKWLEQKQSELTEGKKMILVNKYEL